MAVFFATATIGTGKERAAIQAALNDAMRQMMRQGSWKMVL